MIDFDSALNEQQLEVVQDGDGACLVLAGAGSGKTRTIVYRVAWLLTQGISPENVLLLTFTNRAAREMMERLRELMADPLDGLTGGTFHSVAVRHLRQYAPLIGYSPGFTILDSDDSEGMMSLAMRDEGIDLKSKSYPKPKAMCSIVSYARNAGLTLEEVIEERYPGYERVQDDIDRSWKQYSKREKDANVMDFDDLLVNFLVLLEKQKNVRERLSQQYQYILVDEYQDTNKIQSAIVKQLSCERQNVLAVGDDAQSIYSFRAADIQNILQFEKQYKDARVFRLELNYRSTPEILGVANQVIKKNKEQYKKVLKPVCASADKPQLVTLSHQFQEAQYIAQVISDRLAIGVPPSKLAVLFRATFHSQALEVELMKRGIQYDYRGGLRFFERAHVKDVLCFLRVYHNVHDILAWQRILKLQAGIGEKTANKIIMALKEVDSIKDVVLYDLAESMPLRARDGWLRVQGIARDMVNCNGGAGELIDAVYKGGYKDYLEEQYVNAYDRAQDIEQLQIYGTRVKDVEQFLTETSLSQEYSRQAKGARGSDRVVLSTIHQAKGLEWDTVIVMRLVQGGLPNDRAALERGGIEEERRLFYVAVTRAQRSLVLTYPIMGGYDGTTMFEPSMFLSEIDPDLIETGDEEDTIIIDEDSERNKYVKSVVGNLLSDVKDL